VLERFGQIEPKLLVTADGYQYQGKTIDSLATVRQIADSLPSLKQIVVIPNLSESPPIRIPRASSWDDFVATDVKEIEFVELPFDHPVYIMYSSGTTGAPKCMVHGAGGTLLQHYKEHVLHTDLKQGEVISYYTTCGWMMWNWLVSALQVGSTVFLYDGSPVFPNTGILWSAIEKERIAVFGTSPKFLSVCQQRRTYPARDYDLASLRTILSTGAPLSAGNFSWVYSYVNPGIQLASISGGTDLISCFMLGNPIAPVFSEEIQTRGLGMKVETYNQDGKPVTGEVGELVCTAPFPSMPVFFWNDPDGSRYQSAYFDRFPGVWRHGDYIGVTDHGGVIVYGRSDATLNPGGVRIGTAEIYGSVEALPEIADSIVIGQQWKKDTRIVLFVVLAESVEFDAELVAKIRSAIRTNATSRHLPSKIIPVEEIPHTLNGKKVEIAVTDVVHGRSVTNRDALANPDALDQFIDLPELQAD
jgi:acetoacetyl-CoA synthetase